MFGNWKWSLKYFTFDLDTFLRFVQNFGVSFRKNILFLYPVFKQNTAFFFGDTFPILLKLKYMFLKVAFTPFFICVNCIRRQKHLFKFLSSDFMLHLLNSDY